MSRKIGWLLASVLCWFGMAGSGIADDFAKGSAAHNKKDYATAVKWHKKAAEQGVARAQYDLGVVHHEGIGIAQNDRQAVKW